LNIPATLLEELKHIPAFEKEAFLAAHDTPAPTSLRLHPVKGINVFTDSERIPWCSDGRYLPTRPVFTLDPAFHSGAYYVQEASSMFLEAMLKPLLTPGMRILDLCAAPGGKSTLIASLLDEESLLISNEVIRSRASILEENLTRWGYMNTWVTSNDARDLGRLSGYFDIVVVDAPCSGSGLWRKDAKALDEWSENNVQLCHERQQRILADIWPALKENGVLIYATCSYSHAEDEDVLDWLGDTYSISAIAAPVEHSWGIMQTASPKHNLPGYRFFPHLVKGEGFFIAGVRKQEDAASMKPAKTKDSAAKLQPPPANILNSDNIKIISGTDGALRAIHHAHAADIPILSQHAYLRKTGTELGTYAGKDFIPAHDAALSIQAGNAYPSIDTDRDQALRFLKREDMGIAAAEKGWHLVRYNGWGLGWVKSLGNRMNNYLPKNWRIRMDIE
jgi:16S rRNA C967 or C1407 C5-methylase (RsmB/RsmF family)/NOL1/NOP2/fmu family ribosome biogenesis protein